jgi:hypothetical protein
MGGVQKDTSEPGLSPRPLRLSGAPAIRAHLTLLLGLAFCGLAFWFELGRALRGNELSWAYVFEWPLLGVFAVYMWWNILNPEREKAKAKRTREKKPDLAPEYQGMLTAWQDHQRELSLSQEAADLALKGNEEPDGQR